MGNDSIYSSASRELPPNVENLILDGDNNLNGTGNGLDNQIMGNSGENVLIGMEGNDTLQGNDGDDILQGGQGDDVIDGGEGSDQALYSSTRDKYIVTNNSSDYSVTIKDSRDLNDGTDTISKVELFKFSDVTLTFEGLTGQSSLLAQSAMDFRGDVVKVVNDDHNEFHDGTDTVTGVEYFKFANVTLSLEELIQDTSLNSQGTMDFTGDGIVDSTDALLMMRHMMGTFPGDAITQGIPGIADLNGLREKIMSSMEQSNSLGAGRRMDIDGDGFVNPLSDGLAMTQYIHRKGLPGGMPQMPDVFRNPMRGFDEMQNHLKDLVGF